MLKIIRNRILFLFLLIPSFIFAQSTADSIFIKIQNQPDSAKVRILLNYCWTNRSKHPNEALKCGEEALRISKLINDTKSEAKAYNLTGVVYRNLGFYEKSITSYKSALKISEQIKDSIQIAYSNNNIGGLYRLEGNNTLALEYILRALKLFESLKNKSGMSYCTINIGLIYRRQQNFIKAMEYLNYTLRLREEIGDRPGKALALNLIADVYFEQGDPSSALKYYLAVEKEYEAVDDKKGLAATWGGIGGIYYAQKNYKLALQYREKALEMAKKINYLEGLVADYSNIGLIYAQQGDFKKADENFAKSLGITHSLQEINSRIECYKSYSQYNEIKKNYPVAIEYLKKFQALKDSVNKHDNIAMITEMEAVYKAEKAERENALLTKDIEKEKSQRDYLIIIAILVVVLAIITYSRYHSKKIANNKLQELNTVKDKFFGIIAHDLKNPFNVILGYTDILLEDYNVLNDEERIELVNQIDKASKQTYRLLENLLIWSRAQIGGMEYNPKKFDLAEIIIQVFSLFDSIAKNKNIKLTTNTDNEFEVFGDEEMIRTVIRNLVFNGIKFTRTGGKVEVLTHKEDGHIKVSVEDNGIGISAERIDKLFSLNNITSTEGTASEKGTGLGLILCKELVTKNGGQIFVESKEGKGSQFSFTIPAKN